MSRKSLKELNADRDPQILADNVLRLRNEFGWSASRLAREARIDRSTVKSIESGAGCTPSVERKLDRALRSASGHLWERVDPQFRTIHRAESDRWFFGDRKECAAFYARRDPALAQEAMRQDPDEIQNEAERLRLGRNGFSRSFIRVLTARLVSGIVLSSILELYKPVALTSEEGSFQVYYCLKGGLRIKSENEDLELYEGDSMTFELRKPCSIEPIKPVSANGFPSVYLSVEADPYRTTPLVVRLPRHSATSL